ncbi:hypothetical protein AAGF08_03990 [Algoriphagus sp. SE2]|uniref:hypothetical protein n=1 Tax=Algoriphagus sp. SE2 TaxID=3141536 RepID=UPI0031CCF928
MNFKSQSPLFYYFLFLTLLGLLIVFLGINRGFDVSDEGLYLLLLEPTQANEGGIYNYDLFFKLFYKITGLEFGIIGSRILRLISYLIGAYALTQFWKDIHKEKQLNILVFLIATMGLFSGYAFLPPSLSYNSLSVVLACLWLSLIFKNFPDFFHTICLGLVLALFFYVKITVVLTIGFLTLVLFISRKQMNWKRLFLLLLPLFLLEGIFYLVFSESGMTRLQDGFQIMANRTDYNWLNILKNNLVGVYWSILVFIPFFLIQKIQSKFKFVLILLPLVFSIWIFKKTMITDEWMHLLLIGTLSILAWLVGNLSLKKINNSKKSIFLILMLLPFALHFGSNVYFMRLGIHYWVFWVVALLLIIDFEKSPNQKKIILLLPVSSLILLFNGIWLQPFGQINLSNFNQVWEYKKDRRIYLTEEMVETLEDVKLKIQDAGKGEVLAVYRNPGWLVLLGRTSPKSPGIWDLDQLQSFFPNFPSGFNFILYFPYQPLPDNISKDFDLKKYDIAQGEINLLWKK